MRETMTGDTGMLMSSLSLAEDRILSYAAVLLSETDDSGTMLVRLCLSVDG